MPTLAQQEAADAAKVEAYRQQFGNDAAAKLDADLYKLRRAPSGNGYLGGFPRWVVALVAVWVVALETADKLPKLMLAYPSYEAALAEIRVKMMQPDVVTAQLATARLEAEAAQYKPETAKTQLARAESEAVTAGFTAQAAPAQMRLTQANAVRAEVEANVSKELTAATLEKAQNDAKASILAPQLAVVNLAKTTLEAQAAVYQPKINEVNLAKLGIDAKKAAQENAMNNAALSMMAPMLGNLFKQFGIDLPLDKIAPQLEIIDPAARTRDLQSAMPNPNGGQSQQRTIPTASGRAMPDPTPVRQKQPAINCLLPSGSNAMLSPDDCRNKAGTQM